jgi:hypothetical protein
MKEKETWEEAAIRASQEEMPEDLQDWLNAAPTLDAEVEKILEAEEDENP